MASSPAAPPAASTAIPPPAPAAPAPPEPLRARFLSVGDVMLGRYVQRAIDKTGDPEHPFRPLAKLYADVDFTFANLENPFYSGNPRGTPPGKPYAVLWAKPEHAKTLVKYRFLALNLANNHAIDQDVAGIEETIVTLDAAGIAHMGTGKTLDDAWKPMIVDVRGLKIGFVGASLTARGNLGPDWKKHVARIEDEDRLSAACKTARESAHFVVATFHAGDELEHAPNKHQKDFAGVAVKAGADIVIGAHPHVVQPVEKMNGAWVFYSLGNFIFDQPMYDTSEAVAVELRLVLPPGEARATIEKIVLHPVFIDNSAPGPADGVRAARILSRLKIKDWDLPP